MPLPNARKKTRKGPARSSNSSQTPKKQSGARPSENGGANKKRRRRRPAQDDAAGTKPSRKARSKHRGQGGQDGPHSQGGSGAPKRGPKRNGPKREGAQARAKKPTRRAPEMDALQELDGASIDPGATPDAFTELGLTEALLKTLGDHGYVTPTPIQGAAIPHAIAGRDVLGCAQTGTGKTAAFALPILHRLHEAGVADDRGFRYPRALILCPTRELAGQISDNLKKYARHTRLRHTSIYGGVSQFRQEKALAKGVDVLVATPGRLMDLIDQHIVDLGEVETFVLDEADRMLDMGFIHPIRKIAAMIPEDRQTLLFSATMPKEIRALANSLLRDPALVKVTPVASAAPLIEQAVYKVDRHQKQALLEHAIGDQDISRALVFTRTKHGADRVARRLHKRGIEAVAIHGNKTQGQRQRALDAFRKGNAPILVATDVAARGLDIAEVTHVFNFDLPNEPEAYVHRIGRTGRAGKTGVAIAFCDAEERSLLRQIERLTGTKLAELALPSLPEAPKPAGPRPATPKPAKPVGAGGRGGRPDAKTKRNPAKGKPTRRSRAG